MAPEPAAGPGAEAALLAAGLLRREGPALRTTRRWQAAVMRSAARSLAAGLDGPDPRVPFAAALLELLPHATDPEVAAMVEAMLAAEAAEAGQAGAAGPERPEPSTP